MILANKTKGVLLDHHGNDEDSSTPVSAWEGALAAIEEWRQIGKGLGASLKSKGRIYI